MAMLRKALGLVILTAGGSAAAAQGQYLNIPTGERLSAPKPATTIAPNTVSPNKVVATTGEAREAAQSEGEETAQGLSNQAVETAATSAATPAFVSAPRGPENSEPSLASSSTSSSSLSVPAPRIEATPVKTVAAPPRPVLPTQASAPSEPVDLGAPVDLNDGQDPAPQALPVTGTAYPEELQSPQRGLAQERPVSAEVLAALSPQPSASEQPSPASKPRKSGSVYSGFGQGAFLRGGYSFAAHNFGEGDVSISGPMLAVGYRRALTTKARNNFSVEGEFVWIRDQELSLIHI